MKRKIAKLVINTIRSNCIFLVLFLVVILISFISYHSYYPDDNIPDSSLANFMDPNSDECKFNSSQYFNYSLRNFGKHFTVDATGTLPWVSGSNFLLLSDLVYDKPNKDEREMNYFIDTVKTSIDTMKNGQVIFIRGLWLNVDFFFENYYAKIKTKFILITHNSDNEPKEKYKKYLDDAKFIAWFAANVDFSHPKHIAIPLGFENTFWFPPKVKYIRRICSEKQLIPWEKRKHLMYVNINPYTNSKARSYLNGYFKNFKGALINNYRVNYTKFMNIIGNSKYVLCPRGKLIFSLFLFSS